MASKAKVAEPVPTVEDLRLETIEVLTDYIHALDERQRDNPSESTVEQIRAARLALVTIDPPVVRLN